MNKLFIYPIVMFASGLVLVGLAWGQQYCDSWIGIAEQTQIWLGEIAKLLNENQGVIAVIGMFIVIPFALLSDKIMSYFRQREYRRELKFILLHELWVTQGDGSIDSDIKKC